MANHETTLLELAKALQAAFVSSVAPRQASATAILGD
jgi:hypothetical protein